MTKGLPMKPSPMLEEIRKWQAYWNKEGSEAANPRAVLAEAHEKIDTLLALISAQPGGEGVTVETLKATILTVPIRFIDDPNGGFCDELPVYIAENHAENFANAIMELLRPTSPDPARATEEREGK